MPLDSDSWGYRRNMKLSDVRSIEYVIASLTETVRLTKNYKIVMLKKQQALFQLVILAVATIF